MIKVQNIDIWGFQHALRGMRNPMNSWAKADSDFDVQYYDEEGNETYYHAVEPGPNDWNLMTRLFSAGTEHRKYLRQIYVSLDITAPMYFWSEFDTYKTGGITANSTSKMHKMLANPFTVDNWSFEYANKRCEKHVNYVIDALNELRSEFLTTNNAEEKRQIWYAILQLLPNSYNQTRTVTLNYENIFNMIHQREKHKLDEWRTLVKIFKTFPLISELLEECKK